MFEKEKQEKKWYFFDLKTITLSFFIFLTSYFPIILRFNINTLFNINKRGYFNFLFWNIDLGMDKINEKNNLKFLNWSFYFSLLMFIVYLLERISNVFMELCREKSKFELEKKIVKNVPFFNDYDSVKSFSSKIIDAYSNFFFNTCEISIELWSAVKINLARNIKIRTWKQCLVCFLLVSLWFLFLNFLSLLTELTANYKNKKSFLFHFNHQINRLKFSNLNVLWFAIYFLVVSRDYKFAQSELINIILLGGNIQLILNKTLKFIKIIPDLKSTYFDWKNKDKFFVKHIK